MWIHGLWFIVVFDSVIVCDHYEHLYSSSDRIYIIIKKQLHIMATYKRTSHNFARTCRVAEATKVYRQNAGKKHETRKKSGWSGDLSSFSRGPTQPGQFQIRRDHPRRVSRAKAATPYIVVIVAWEVSRERQLSAAITRYDPYIYSGDLASCRSSVGSHSTAPAGGMHKNFICVL